MRKVLPRFLFSTDIKPGYWAVKVLLDNGHYLTSFVPQICQLQETRRQKRVRKFSSLFNEPQIIVLRDILTFTFHFLLLYRDTVKTNTLLTFYINDIFDT